MSLPMHPGRATGRPSAAPTADALARALTRAGAPPVEVHEAFASWVVVTADRAYRLHKRLITPSSDLTTFEGRLHACRATRDADRALGGAGVVGIRSVVPVGDSFALADEGHRDAVDHVVELRRHDEAETLTAHLEEGSLPADTAEAVGRRIAALHAAVPRLSVADPVAAGRTA